MPIYRYFLLVMLAMMVAGDLNAQTTSTTITFEPNAVKGKNTNNKNGADTIYKDGVRIVCDLAAFNYYDTDYRFYAYSDVIITSTVGCLEKIVFTCSKKGTGKSGNNGNDGSPDGFIGHFSPGGNYYLDDSDMKVGVWQSNSEVSSVTITNIYPLVYAKTIAVTVLKYPNTATISSAGYATYSCENAADYSKAYGLRAFKAKYDKDAKKIVLTPVGTVPANTPVVLKGDEGLHAFPTASGTTDDVSDNELKVATEDMTCTGNMWILVKKSNGVGFSPAKEGTTLKKGKCYIEIDASSTASAKFVGLDETTGIHHITASDASPDGKAYNLAGQRVGSDYKGIVIVGGKKVVRR